MNTTDLTVSTVNTAPTAAATIPAIPATRDALALSPVAVRVQSVASKIFTKINQVWGYLGKVLSIVRNVVKIKISTLCSSTTSGLRQISRLRIANAGMGVPVVLSLPGLVAEVPVAAGNIHSGIRLRDGEGAALGALSLSLATLDIADSGMYVWDAVQFLTDSPTLEFYGTVAKPLGIALNVLSIVSRSVKIRGEHSVRKDLAGVVDEESGEVDMDKLSAFMEKHLVVTDEEVAKLADKYGDDFEAKVERLTKKKRAKLERRIGEKGLSGLDKLSTRMKEAAPLTDREVEEAGKLTDAIEKRSWRKTALNIIGIATAVFMIAAILMFTTVLPVALPFGIMIAMMLVKLAMVYYERRYLEKDLDYGMFAE